MKLHYVQDLCREGLIDIVRRAGKEQPADLLTKGMPISGGAVSQCGYVNERYIPILYSFTISNQLLCIYSLSSYSLSYPATVGQSTELDPNDGSPMCIPNDAAIYVYRHKGVS